MIIRPMIRNNICMTAHPLGCARNVQDQIRYVQDSGAVRGPKNALVIGSSAGYGLATRIVAAFGSGASTIGVAFESPAKNGRTATVGWYNDQAFQDAAASTGNAHQTYIGDAFAHQTKADVVRMIRETVGSVDLVVYSLASPLRIDPDTGVRYDSVLKPIGRSYSSFTLDNKTGQLVERTVEAATEEEIANTVKVMGGEDWQLWIEALETAGVLAPDALTVAYSYIGPELTFALYRDGTIGRAKEHLEATAHELNRRLSTKGGRAYVSVNKALVTRASSVIPAVPVYLAILYQVMRDKGLHEGCIEQCYRLFRDFLYSDGPAPVDDKGRIRIDDWEMRADVQAEVAERWTRVTATNLPELGDVDAIQTEFLNIHGFGYPDIDYEADIEP